MKSDSANLADQLAKSKQDNPDSRQRSNTYSGTANDIGSNFPSPPAPDRSKNVIDKGKKVARKLFKS